MLAIEFDSEAVVRTDYPRPVLAAGEVLVAVRMAAAGSGDNIKVLINVS